MDDEFAFPAADLAETKRIAARLATLIQRAAAEGAGLVVGLSGPLGAGKTTFVQGVVAALAPDEDVYVTSPTYSIHQSYPTEPPISHLDLYRLEGLEDLEAIGYRDIYFGAGAALVEWIERVPEAIPPEWIEIQLAPRGSDVRFISVRPHGRRFRQLAQEVFGP